MKPTSIIFLILSVVLVISGTITCGVAKTIAAKDGIEIFDRTEKDENNNTVTKLPLDDSLYGKISIDVKDANVSVYGNASESYIELVNYSANSYTTSVSNGCFSFDDDVSILSVFSTTEGTIGFKGLRYYFTEGGRASGVKKINVYLTSDYDLNGLDVNVENADFSVTKLDAEAEYSVDISGGNVTLSNISCADEIEINGSDGNVVLENSSQENLVVNITNGNYKNIISSVAYEYTSFILGTSGGAVYINGENKGESFSITSSLPDSAANISVTSGDISIETYNQGNAG